VLRPIQQPSEIHSGRLTLEPVLGELLRVTHQMRRPG